MLEHIMLDHAQMLFTTFVVLVCPFNLILKTPNRDTFV